MDKYGGSPTLKDTWITHWGDGLRAGTENFLPGSISGYSGAQKKWPLCKKSEPLCKKNDPCAKKMTPCAKKMTPVQKKWA